MQIRQVQPVSAVFDNASLNMLYFITFVDEEQLQSAYLLKADILFVGIDTPHLDT